MRPLSVLLTILVIGCRNSEPGPSPAPSGAPTPVHASAAAAPWLTVPLDKLLGTYKDNEVKGDNEYKGKVIRVAGLVGEVKKDVTDAIYVTVGKGALIEIPLVQCFTATGEEGAAAALKKGDPIAVEGRVDGLMTNVLIKDCRINPMMKTCERLSAAIGGKCAPMKDTPDGATLEQRGDKEAIVGAIMCLPTKERYQKGLDVFKDKTLVGNERALCLGTFEVVSKAGKSGPLTDDKAKAKLKSFFDAL